MDELKNYIDQHRSQFDEEEPLQGHFDRLDAKLSRPRKLPLIRRMVQYWPHYAVAASVLLLISLGLNWFFTQDRSKTPITVLCNDPADIKYCYLDQMYSTAMFIDELTENADPFVRQAVQMEVVSIIEANQRFDEELPMELSQEQSLAILSEYYQHNLETLQDIAQTLLADNSKN